MLYIMYLAHENLGSIPKPHREWSWRGERRGEREERRQERDLTHLTHHCFSNSSSVVWDIEPNTTRCLTLELFISPIYVNKIEESEVIWISKFLPSLDYRYYMNVISTGFPEQSHKRYHSFI